MFDNVLRLLALAGFAASLAVLAVYVPSPDLVIVVAVVLAMAAFDFLLRPVLLRRNRRRPN
jgi:hypothetical protein